MSWVRPYTHTNEHSTLSCCYGVVSQKLGRKCTVPTRSWKYWLEICKVCVWEGVTHLEVKTALNKKWQMFDYTDSFRNPRPWYNTLYLQLIPRHLYSACPYRQFNTQSDLLYSQAALLKSYPNTCLPRILYNIKVGLWSGAQTYNHERQAC